MNVPRRGQRLGDADAEDPRRVGLRVYAAVEPVGVLGADESGHAPGVSMHLEHRAPFRRLVAVDDSVVSAAVRILERDSPLHAREYGAGEAIVRSRRAARSRPRTGGTGRNVTPKPNTDPCQSVPPPRVLTGVGTWHIS